MVLASNLCRTIWVGVTPHPFKNKQKTNKHGSKKEHNSKGKY